PSRGRQRCCVEMSAEPAPPAAVVIFGASGDLASRKLLPALDALAHDALLDPSTWVIGVGRSELGDDGWRDVRDKAVDGDVVIEKPFGTDLESSRELDTALHTVLSEPQIFRIDHYLGKETVQNVLALRFSNAILEPVWNRQFVDSVQLTVAESVGVGHRAGF